MSQQALGSAIGVTLHQVMKYEKGRNRIPISHLAEIATALKVPVAFLRRGDEIGASSEAIDLLAREDVRRFMTAFAAIPDPTVKRSLAGMVCALAKP